MISFETYISICVRFDNMVKLTTLQWRHTNSQLLHDNSSMEQLAISFQTQLVDKVLFRIPILKSVFNVPMFN